MVCCYAEFVLSLVICIAMYYNITMKKASVVTIRLSAKENRYIVDFLKENPFFEGFSSLARVALLDFMARKGSIKLKPVVSEDRPPKQKPSFLWDYDLSEGEIREILSSPFERRKWLVAKILEHAIFEEVWKYLTLEQIEKDLPRLRIPEKIKGHWQYAIEVWRKKHG